MVNKKNKAEEGMSLDDAFADDGDVEYAKTKPKKSTSKKIENTKISQNDKDEEIAIKSSKPISELKKGDKIKADSLTLEVDAHYILIDHENTKEMAIELFDTKKDKDYQLRYFSDNVENSLQFYELDEIVYNKVEIKKIEW